MNTNRVSGSVDAITGSWDLLVALYGANIYGASPTQTTKE
jgi:hypothetical protein